jgi:hypothetical protein
VSLRSKLHASTRIWAASSGCGNEDRGKFLPEFIDAGDTPLQKAVHQSAALSIMSSRTTPDEETSPLLRNRRTKSHQSMQVAGGNTLTANDEEVPGVNIVSVLAVLWPAVFLSALNGALFRRFL